LLPTDSMPVSAERSQLIELLLPQYAALPAICSGLAPHTVGLNGSDGSIENSTVTGRSGPPKVLGYCSFQNVSMSFIASRANRSIAPPSVLSTVPLGGGLVGRRPLGPAFTSRPPTRSGSYRIDRGCPGRIVGLHPATTSSTADMVPSRRSRRQAC